LHPKKGCDLVLRAYADVLANENTERGWHLVMAGPDQIGWQAELQRMAKSLGIEAQVTWAGMLAGDEKWGALRVAECFLLPSHQENFGVVVAESLACGTPVLISNKINIWREITAAGAGFVAPDTLPGAVSLLRNWLDLTPEHRGAMRELSLACFEKKFEIKTATSNLLQILAGLLLKEQTPPCLEKIPI
jgi:glycosyltransferase involved in cell wall biosynthesis